LGSALSDQGCRVDYFSYEHAFGHDTDDSVACALRFPWRVQGYLRRRASQFDVLEVSAGDAWAWAMRGRPGSTFPGAGRLPALISRSHCLEHTYDQSLRADAEAGKLVLSYKYPFYHGGYRLWEVQQSIVRSDHTIVSNETDRDFIIDQMDVSPLLVTAISSGIGGQFIGLAPPAPVDAAMPLRLVVVGPWTDRHGRRVVVQTAALLHQANVPFTLTLLGSGADEVETRMDFPADARPHIRVMPEYRPSDLPALLGQHHVLLMCGLAEPHPMALSEAMACGLAPIATRLGGASRVILPGSTGELIDSGDSHTAAAVITRWAVDRDALQSIRRRAQQAVQRDDWHQVAGRTIHLYEQVLKRVAGQHAPVQKPASATLTPAESIWQSNGKPSLTLCICTANRPAMLRRCLASIEQGDVVPAEVVVGDDTLDGTETAAVCREFSFVRYVRGPRRGVCANRNVVIAAALGDYISLLDDDAEVTPSFVRLATDLAASADGRTIFTGDVLEHGIDRVPPTNPTFWGHFGKPLSEVCAPETVHLNCNLFPRSAFRDARFDEHIVFGFQDMDLCQQMLAAGYRIEYRRELLNLHLPPPRPTHVENFTCVDVERARYYTSLKRYMLWQCRPMRAFAYAALAPMHQAAHYILRRQVGQALTGFGDMSWALNQAMAFRKSVRDNEAARK
jgi:glycosyltransferase involved in cell wall biosynthesis/GT2 family glycosyltransferase